MRACGNCQMPLSSLDSSPGLVEGASQSGDHATINDASVELRHLQADMIQDPLKTHNSKLLWLAIIMLIIGVFDFLSSFLSDGDLSIMSILLILPGVLFLFTFVFIRKQASKMAQYIWQRGDVLAPMAESRGMNISGLLVIPFVMIVSIMMRTLFHSDDQILIALAVGLLISIVLFLSLIRSKLMIQSDSILVGIPSGLMMLRLPFKKIHSVRLRGRLLKVIMTERISPLTSKTSRYLILGDPRPVATAIQAIGMTRGMDINVENAEIDAELLKSCMKVIQHKNDDMRHVFDDGHVIATRLLVPKRSTYPEFISILLLIAGISALVTGFVLSFIDRMVAEDIGRHLIYIECCAILEFLFGAIIIAGALMARRRKKFGLVKVSAIIAIISFGGFVSTILGIISLVLLIKSADEFEE